MLREGSHRGSPWSLSGAGSLHRRRGDPQRERHRVEARSGEVARRRARTQPSLVPSSAPSFSTAAVHAQRLAEKARRAGTRVSTALIRSCACSAAEQAFHRLARLEPGSRVELLLPSGRCPVRRLRRGRARSLLRRVREHPSTNTRRRDGSEGAARGRAPGELQTRKAAGCPGRGSRPGRRRAALEEADRDLRRLLPARSPRRAHPPGPAHALGDRATATPTSILSAAPRARNAAPA